MTNGWRGLVAAAVLGHLGVAAAQPVEPDFDGDGIPDAIEIETGTRPDHHDTDRDGVPDGIEDRNRDGILDIGESDPRVHGLYPGEFPHIPEPMVFDLVRGLGARRGELEGNTLFVRPLRAGSGLAWAPEIEYAFADGYAVELELPMLDQHVEALKFAIQGTLPETSRRFIHGWQLMGEYVLSEAIEGTLLYLAGARIGRAVSLFTMLGPRLTRADAGDVGLEILANPSAFIDLKETLTVGLETNLALGSHGLEARWIPQVHWQVARHLRIQAGAGMELLDSRLAPLVSSRIIVE